VAVADWKWLRQTIAGVGAAIAGWGLTLMGPSGLMLWWIVLGSSVSLLLSPREEWSRYVVFASRIAGGIGLTLVAGEWFNAWINATTLPRTRVEYAVRCSVYVVVLVFVRFEMRRRRRVLRTGRGEGLQ
jgi:hypothetical protein